MYVYKNIIRALAIIGFAIAAMVVMVVPGITSEDSGNGSDIYDALVSETSRITPSVPEYEIEPDLSNVENLTNFDGELTSEQLDMIAANGFVVTPSDGKQIFWIYEQNDYSNPKIPSFITTDSILHTYHFFFDYVLRTVETSMLIPALSDLNEAMLSASEDDMDSATDPDIEDAAWRNVAYFAVARYLLDGTSPPASVEDMVMSEVGKIEAHQSRAVSDIFDPVLIDYTQFVPRGHYTRTEELKKYFMAMMWYGLVPIIIDNTEPGMNSTRQALLIVNDLRNASFNGTSAIDLWETIYHPTGFFVGESDNITFYDLSGIMDDVFGSSLSPDNFSTESGIRDFIARVKDLPVPGIEQYVPVTSEEEESGDFSREGRVFNFMGQRYIPDSRVFQELILPKVPERDMPVGLDVFAAMGSDRALDILGDYYGVHDYTGYDSQMEKMRMEIEGTSLELWQWNLYSGWLWSLRSLNEPVGEGYPAFMRNDAWLDKSLFTSLGSWTELRHDTVLYARQSGAECGMDEPPPPPKSYIEPNIEFWNRMEWLVEFTADGLNSRDLMNGTLTNQFERLGDLVTFCRGIVMKELGNEEITSDEYDRMTIYGGMLESLMLSCAGGDLLSEADKDMALVVDVHTANGTTVLQEATGRVGVIYVVVPVDGKLYLSRGGTYTQYEFTHPASDRLTDEQWREMLNNNVVPPLAEWTDSFIVTLDEAPMFDESGGGC
ncbi:MAG: DUF3160 domain-containing protein [bacterium]|nr:DUF3160 domain-containing protein [bacterium]